MNKKNILFISISWPDKGSRNLYKDLMDEFRDHGHQVFVICSDDKLSTNSHYGKEEGINVLRVKTLRVRKVGRLGKALALPTLPHKFKKQINKNFKHHQFDLLITHTPPITLSSLMAYLRKKYKAKFYLLLKDIWPHNQADLGLIRKKGIIWRYFRYHEKKIYRTADHIGCMSPKNVEYILEHNPYLDPQKVEVNPNSWKLREKKKVNTYQIRKKYNIPEDATVFIFSGNLSKGHNLEFFIETIHELKDYKKAFFIIGGKGIYYNYLARKVRELDLTNTFLYYYLPEEDFENILYASDVGLILLDYRHSCAQFPSRLLSYLEASKPVLCSVNHATDIGEIVEHAECGIKTLNNNRHEFIKAVQYLSEHQNKIKYMSNNAYQLFLDEYNSKNSFKIIMNHFPKNSIH